MMNLGVISAMGRRWEHGPLIDYDLTTGSLPSGVTLTRASTGTYFNSSGVLSTASSDVARLDYNPATLALRGLLIEPQRKNYIAAGNSYSLSGAVLENVTRTLNAQTSPDGTTNASLFVPSVNNTKHDAYYASVYVDGNNRTGLSVYAKPSGYSYFQIRGASNLSYVNVYDMSALSVTAEGGVAANPICTAENISNGYARYSILATVSDSSKNNWPSCEPVTSGTPSWDGTQNPIFAGDGSSGCLMFGVQLEVISSGERDKISSYIPTTGSAATRAADVLQFTIPSGVSTLRYTFDDDTTQNVSVSAGAYTVPTNLNRAWIKRIQSI